MNYEIKYDKGKPLYADVPKELLDAVSAVMEYGKNKYGISTWHVVEPERYVNAMLRHIYAMQTVDTEGKQTIDLSKVDSESGIKHLYHIACNIAFIIAITERTNCKENKDER